MSFQLWPLVNWAYFCETISLSPMIIFSVQLIHQTKKNPPLLQLCHFPLLALSNTLSASLFCVSLRPFSRSRNLSNVFLPLSPCAFVGVIFSVCSFPNRFQCSVLIWMNLVFLLLASQPSLERTDTLIFFFFISASYTSDSCLLHAHPVPVFFSCKLSLTLILCNLNFLIAFM